MTSDSRKRSPLDEYVRGQRIEGYLQDRYTRTTISYLLFLDSVLIILTVPMNSLSNHVAVCSLNSLINLSSNSLTESTTRHRYPHFSLLLSVTPSLKSSRASHYILELKRKLSQYTEIKMAAYYKDLDRHSNKLMKKPLISIKGSAMRKAPRFFLRHQRGDRFFGWISYAYAQSPNAETVHRRTVSFLFV